MLKQFQELLKKNNLNFYLIPTSDDHNSEYVGDYYKFREFLSGFTGSAGTLLISQTEAWLWTDGRYFLQAEKQLVSGITLMKSGNPGVPTIYELLEEISKEEDVLGYNGSVCMHSLLENIQDAFFGRVQDIDLYDEIWLNRPSRSHHKVYLYDEKYHGTKVLDKLKQIRESLVKYDCDEHLLTTLDDIAWTFNIRGSDIDCTPVPLAFAIITMHGANLYLQKNTYSNQLKETLEKDHVYIHNYDDIYNEIEGDISYLIDPNHINERLFNKINGFYEDEKNPSEILKAIKNETEIKNTINAHIKDGIAMFRFLDYIKHADYTKLNEMDVVNKIYELRSSMDDFKDISFDTIAGCNENGAIVHYQPNRNNCKQLEEGLLLVDSGAQFMDGTTDITRMYALGKPSKEMLHHSTLVLKGHLALMNATFLKGTCGQNLDILARTPLYNEGLNFNHGTGHGVGHFLSVHEGPHSIRNRFIENENPTPLVPGNVVTDEPGIYIEGSHGIRWENELLVVEDQENEFGTFYKFKPLTLVPYDLDTIHINELTQDEKDQINKYHQYVYEMLESHLNDEEKEKLKYYTKKID